MKILTYAVWSISGVSLLALMVATVVYVAMGAPELGQSWPHIVQAWVAILSMVGVSVALWWYGRD